MSRQVVSLGGLCGQVARAENFEGYARFSDLRAKYHLGGGYDWIGTSMQKV